jgi:hypothetical protein
MTKRMADGKTGKKVKAPHPPLSPLVLFGRQSSLGHFVLALPLWEERQDKDKTTQRQERTYIGIFPQCASAIHLNPPPPTPIKTKKTSQRRKLAKTSNSAYKIFSAMLYSPVMMSRYEPSKKKGGQRGMDG